MSYRIRRVDNNQQEIVKAMRDMGALVLILSSVGNGCPDLLVGVRASNGQRHCKLVEVKDGSKPPSQRKLTPCEASFHQIWDGFVEIVSSVGDAVKLVNNLSCLKT